MNRQQSFYMAGRIVGSNEDILRLSAYAGCGLISAFTIPEIFNGGYVLGSIGIASGVLAFKNLVEGAKAFHKRAAAYLGASGLDGEIVGTREIRRRKADFPLEYASRVIMDDIPGLAGLLHETCVRHPCEWGTLIRAHDEAGRAVVSKIEDPGDMRAKGFFYDSALTSLKLNAFEAERKGYNGFHHYHPSHLDLSENGDNYAINLTDRVKPANWINLLTFMMPSGPEVIAFNRQFVYIPENKAKTVLVKADKKMVLDYLVD